MHPRTRTIQIARRVADHHFANDLMVAAHQAFDASVEVLVIDLEHVDFIDAWGLAALAAVKTRAPAGTIVAIAAWSGFADMFARATRLRDVHAVESIDPVPPILSMAL